MEIKQKPYSVGDLIDVAIGKRGVDADRVIATYADRGNWKVVNAKDENGNMRAYWTWHGPVIVGYELATWVDAAVADGREEEERCRM